MRNQWVFGPWDVEVIRLDGRERIRVRCHGVLIRYCRSVVDGPLVLV
ncbi:hypothetical protein [Thermomonospora umbrina]|nr:hypothetical protein [Thermomonospora umbrina]